MSVCGDKVCEAKTAPCCDPIVPSICGNRDLAFPSDSCSTVRIEGTSDTTINQGAGIDLTDGVHAYDGDGNEIPFEVEPETIPKCDVGEHLVKYTAIGKGASMRPSLCGNNALAVSDACSDLTTVEEDRIVTITQADPPTINGIDEVEIRTSTDFDPTDGVNAVDDNGNAVPFEYSGRYDKRELGSLITLENDGSLAVKSLKVSLDPIQDLNGYDKPWAAGNGKNKSPLGIVTTSSSGSIPTSTHIYDAIVQGTTYSLSFDVLLPQKEGTAQGNRMGVWLNDTGTAIIRPDISSTGHMSVTFTAESNGYINFWSGSNTYDANVKAIDNVQLEIGSTASDYKPYSNICPISGRTECVTNVSPTTSEQDATTYTTDLGRTVYGGTLDVVSGELVVTHGIFTNSGTGSWNRNADGSFYLWTAEASGAEQAPDGACNYCPYAVTFDGFNAFVRPTNSTILLAKGWGDTYATADELKSAFASNPLQIVYPLAEPQTYQLTETQINLLTGENNVWSEDGDIDLIYEMDIPQSGSYQYPLAGNYEITYTAEDECGNSTEVTRHIYVGTKRTVLYSDGTLIINEREGDIATNRTNHGTETNTYPPLDEEHPYDWRFGVSDPYWYEERASILAVEIGSTISPRHLDHWFPYHYNCKSFDLHNIDGSQVTSMRFMFNNCRAVEEIDISPLGALSISSDDLDATFWNCSELTTIYANHGFTVTTSSDNTTFQYSPQLVGGSGTQYDAYHVSAEYARIDNPPDAPGYFTRKNS